MRMIAAGLLAIGVAASAPARAELQHLALSSPAAPAFGGQEFGSAGAYVRVAGKATVAIDPADARNALIADIALAPRDAAGRVQATAEVVILRPADMVRGNGTLLLEIPNRGREIIGQLMNDSAGANVLANGTAAGNGHLLAQGYTLAWIGWQADLAPGTGMRLDAPILPGVTGPSREEFLFDHSQSPVAAPLTYPARWPGGRHPHGPRPGRGRQADTARPRLPLPRSAADRDHPPARLRCRRIV